MQGVKWRFCLDRGGTFTDVVALAPDGRLLMDKTPSDSVRGGLQVLRRHLALPPDAPLPAAQVADIRIGTTISTNMLLEKKGERTALLVTRGFRDILLIGDQTRPALFALDVRRPPPLYDTVLEVPERIAADGQVVHALDEEALREIFASLRRQNYDSITIAFMHASQHPAHERTAAALARACGFARVVASHQVSALMKYIPRANTAVADAYLDAGLRDYVNAVSRQCERGVEVLFMQSNGALAAADAVRAVNTILSGPAGGAVGMKKSAQRAGYARVIGFDMGGTSTDVCIAGEDEGESLRLENRIAEVPLFVPMLDIHTVAAGGGSIVHYRDQRLQVGPHSAGAQPGPACYRNGGPLTITDCNVLLGKLPLEFFPPVFGAEGNQPPDAAAVHEKFAALAAQTGLPAVQLAEEFIRIAVEQMAGAIRRLALARAVALPGCALNSFGGAAGQHACLVADAVGIRTVLVTRQASVLSAWGIGAADVGALKNRSVECALDAPQLDEVFAELTVAACAELPADSTPIVERTVRCRVAGVDAQLPIRWRRGEVAAMRAEFEAQHAARYGISAANKKVLVAVAEVRAVLRHTLPPAAHTPAARAAQALRGRREVLFNGKARQTKLYDWDKLPPDTVVNAPAVITNALNTIVVEPGWQARVEGTGDLLLQKTAAAARRQRRSQAAMIEIMNSRFTFVAEQMGELLRQTAMSVNIRERLDFSCALFDHCGNLVANAPHIPVHLGSMSESVRHLHRKKPPGWARGDVFLINSPYHGGTHLPDITVIRPGRLDGGSGKADFYVAARGHHSDVGGVSPGSMPAVSRHIEEEGVLFDLTPLVVDGVFAEDAVRRQLQQTAHPARKVEENLSDLRAQVAATAAGVAEMQRSGREFGDGMVRRYLRLVQKNAEAAARRVLCSLADGAAQVQLDDGSCIAVAVHIDRRTGEAVFDFGGSAKQHAHNFNAPRAVMRAAVIYCLRALLGENIPLNDGLLRPVLLCLPRASLLNPRAPAAVAAGNVEVSQHIVDAVLAALGVCANAQGTCNNLTIGSANWQYYETVCGGMGACATAAGADAVQVHMTNSRASDPEVLEWNYPMRVEEFSIRRGSGGAGQHQGGDGAVRRLRVLTAAEVNLLTSRRCVPPQGVNGGAAGACGSNYVERADGTRQPLAGCESAALHSGDCIVLETPGGGGFGKASQ